MKLVKIAIFGGLLLLVMPSNGAERTAFYSNLQQIYDDMTGFCGRKPQVCNDAVSAFYGIGDKLGNMAHSIESMLVEVGIGVDRRHLQQPLAELYSSDMVQTTASLHHQDTLTDKDRIPGWRGPQ
jgi:hypothetical protein